MTVPTTLLLSWCVGATNSNANVTTAPTPPPAPREFWSFKTGARVASSPVLDANATTVWFGSDDNHSYAVDVSTGALRWIPPTQVSLLTA